jgi:hypothetical protein
MANKNYLDKTGLLFFWGKVKDWISGRHFLSYDEQGLTDTQKAQARTNIGAYSKPATGIGKDDLSQSVQTSLGLADTALQSHQDISNKVDKVDGKGLSTEDYTTAEKTKLAGIDENANNYSLPAATSSVRGGVKVGSNINLGGTGNDTISVPDGSSSTKGVVQLSTDIASDASSNAKAATPQAVVNYVSTQVATVFSWGDSCTFANLPAPSANTVNKIYNISDAFTTTSDFVEGSGKDYPAGTNLLGVKIGNDYKYDATTGFVDLSPYALDSELIAITDSEITAIVS